MPPKPWPIILEHCPLKLKHFYLVRVSSLSIIARQNNQRASKTAFIRPLFDIRTDKTAPERSYKQILHLLSLRMRQIKSPFAEWCT